MLSRAYAGVGASGWLILALSGGFSSLASPVAVVTQTNVSVRVMAANLTSNNGQAYEAPGIRIFQGLKPDIVAIQEFNSTNTTANPVRTLVNQAFGTSFSYFRETGYSIPNGIVSRWPILGSGSWEDVDPGVNDRGFAWARIDVPGTNDLYVVSIHLKASSGSAEVNRRYAEATNLVNLIRANFPANAWVVVGGDCNIYDPSEPAYQHLTSTFSDNPIPTDAASGGDADTNLARSERYDYVYVSQSLSNRLAPTVMASRTFPNGLVFDSRVYPNLSDVAPVLSTDSGVSGMQHMGVLRTLSIPYTVTNYLDSPAITADPTNATVAQGASVMFTATATGTAPLWYQWSFESAAIAGATNASLAISNAQPADMGGYSVVVTNIAGGATSAVATLALVVPAPAVEVNPAGWLCWQGLSNLTYTVQGKTNLNQRDWNFIGTAASPSATIIFTNPAGTAQGFFRVVYP